MTAGPRERDTPRRLRWVVGAALMFGVAAALAATVRLGGDEGSAQGPTVGERLTALKAERASLQARADGAARIGLLQEFRVASLLSDALAVRHDGEAQRTFERLPPPTRQPFADVDSLNAALKDALARPGEGARLAAHAAAERAQRSLERLAGSDDAPLVRSFTPRFVPPRRATGELTLAPGVPGPPPREGILRVDPVPKIPGAIPATPTVPTDPRYAPSFAATSDDDPPVTIEVAGRHLAVEGGPPPVLSIGAWRGEAAAAPERLRFSVPRRAFAADAVRTTFVSASLAVRRASRASSFELLFVVLPDRPGSFALDQRVRTTVPEVETLVSPEILARGTVGETKTVRRCFDPPAGWRFDKARRRVVIVERLGWLDDVSDETMNGGSVEFAPDEEPGKICVVVTARPVTRAARAATIGRFEATLVRDRSQDRAVQSGVRALDWHEAVRMPIEPGAVEWKLYVRLFDEIDREFIHESVQGPAETAAPADVPFLHIAPDAEGRTITLQADPAAEP
ncbi:MAG: hypothetical protein ACHQK9_01060 [Reyranellales bacterium]